MLLTLTYNKEYLASSILMCNPYSKGGKDQTPYKIKI